MSGNLLSTFEKMVELKNGGEMFTPLLDLPNLRVVRICSAASDNKDNEWYDQEDNELVFLFEGSATLQYADSTEVEMTKGSYVYIPRHVKHRVIKNSANTVWVAIHHDGDAGTLLCSSTVNPHRLEFILTIAREACEVMTPMVMAFYTAMNSSTSKLKSDKSVFTIADGTVQHLLINHLFCGNKFKNIVGEEDVVVNLSTLPYTIDGLTVPEQFSSLIQSVQQKVSNLSKKISSTDYQELTVFIDPIDGTREFSTGKGEQCSICIGFADADGKSVGGIVYRPITSPPTWAAGAVNEGYVAGKLDLVPLNQRKNNGLLTSNGGISKFIEELLTQGNFERVKSGGAGNKALMLLEGKGGLYLQDRGVSRWDTCAVEAMLAAHGGELFKLSSITEQKLEQIEKLEKVEQIERQAYTYLESSSEGNRDFIPSLSNLTPYNAAPTVQAFVKTEKAKGNTVKADTVDQVLPYSNLCGLFAVNATTAGSLLSLVRVVRKTASVVPASFD